MYFIFSHAVRREPALLMPPTSYSGSSLWSTPFQTAPWPSPNFKGNPLEHLERKVQMAATYVYVYVRTCNVLFSVSGGRDTTFRVVGGDTEDEELDYETLKGWKG
jgi:hypothetical protein